MANGNDFDDDFDDMDFDLDGDFSTEDTGDSDSRDPVTQSLSDASSSIAESIVGAEGEHLEAASNMAKAMIPSKLRKESALAGAVTDSIQTESKKAINELRSTGRELTTLVGRVLPPSMKESSLFQKIESFMEDKSSTGNTESVDEKTNNLVIQAMGDQQDREIKQKQLDDVIAANRNRDQMHLLSMIAANTDSVRLFNNDVSNNYMRKSLELQYKQLFVSKDALTASTTFFDMMKGQVEALVKNTALPDVVKLRGLEQAKHDLMRNVTGRMFNVDGLQNSIVSNIQKKANAIKTSVKEGMEDTIEMLDPMADMAEMKREMEEMGMGESKSSMLGGFAGDFIRDKIGNKLGAKLASSDKAKAYIKEMKTFALDPSGALKDKANSTDSGIRKSILNFASDMTKREIKKADSIIVKKDDLSTAASWTHKNSKSLDNTIPGYLAKILASTEGIRTNTTVEEEVYDYTTDSFTSREKIKAFRIDKFKKDIAKKTTKSGMMDSVDKFVKTIEKNLPNGLSSAENRELKNAMIRSLATGETFKINDLANSALITFLSPEMAGKLVEAVEHISGNEDDDKSYKDLFSLDSAYHAGINKTINPEDLLVNAQKDGSIDDLLSSGVVKLNKETGAYTINQDKFVTLLQRTDRDISMKKKLTKDGFKSVTKTGVPTINKITDSPTLSVKDPKNSVTNKLKTAVNKFKEDLDNEVLSESKGETVMELDKDGIKKMEEAKALLDSGKLNHKGYSKLLTTIEEKHLKEVPKHNTFKDKLKGIFSLGKKRAKDFKGSLDISKLQSKIKHLGKVELTPEGDVLKTAAMKMVESGKKDEKWLASQIDRIERKHSTDTVSNKVILEQREFIHKNQKTIDGLTNKFDTAREKVKNTTTEASKNLKDSKLGKESVKLFNSAKTSKYGKAASKRVEQIKKSDIGIKLAKDLEVGKVNFDTAKADFKSGKLSKDAMEAATSKYNTLVSNSELNKLFEPSSKTEFSQEGYKKLAKLDNLLLNKKIEQDRYDKAVLIIKKKYPHTMVDTVKEKASILKGMFGKDDAKDITADKETGVLGKLTAAIEGLKPKKKETIAGDTDGDGLRDSGWRNLLKPKKSINKKDTKAPLKSKTAKDDSSGMFGGLLGKILGIGGSILSAITVGLSPLISIAKGIFGLPGKLMGLLAGLTGLGGKTALSGTGTAKKVVAKKAAKKVGMGMLARTAGRFIPGVGLAMAAWDAGNIGYKMLHDDMSASDAFKEQVLGIEHTEPDLPKDNPADIKAKKAKMIASVKQPISVPNAPNQIMSLNSTGMLDIAKQQSLTLNSIDKNTGESVGIQSKLLEELILLRKANESHLAKANTNMEEVKEDTGIDKKSNPADTIAPRATALQATAPFDTRRKRN